MRLILKAFAKVNLGLEVLRRREDDYHEIETILQTIDLADELSFSPRKEEISIKCQPPLLPSDSSNLVYRASHLIKERFKVDKGVHISLNKRIPLGAGLGGGSSDAASTLIGLNIFWRLNLAHIDLFSLAKEIGSDVPFFLTGGTALARGRGELIEPLPHLPPAFFVLIFPPFSISTEWAYKNLKLRLTEKSEYIKIIRKGIEEGNLKKVAQNLYNRLEEVVFANHPILKEIKDGLISAGVLGAVMSGSGSTIFGIVAQREDLSRIKRKFSNLWGEVLIASGKKVGYELV